MYGLGSILQFPHFSTCMLFKLELRLVVPILRSALPGMLKCRSLGSAPRTLQTYADNSRRCDSLLIFDALLEETH